MPRCIGSLSSPSLPFTTTMSLDTVTSTPEGTGMGLRPTLDIFDQLVMRCIEPVGWLPDVEEQLSADACASRVAASHDSRWR